MVKQDPDYTVFAKEYAAKERETTKQELKFLDAIFKKNRVKKVLDVACGPGRLTFLLNELGYEMFGTDLSSEFIEMNKEKAKTLGRSINFSVENMSSMKKHDVFDAAICMWGSFTYLERIDEMIDTLKGMNRNLKKGGILIIDVAPGWYDVVVGKRYKIKMHDKPVKNGKICVTDVQFDSADQFSLQHDEYVTYVGGKIKSVHKFDRKRYHFTPTMFDLLLRNSGFKIDAFYSDRDVKKKLPQKKLNRLIVVAKKV